MAYGLELQRILRAVQEDYKKQHRLASSAQIQFAASAPQLQTAAGRVEAKPWRESSAFRLTQELQRHPFRWLVRRISELTGLSIREIGTAANRLATPEGLEPHTQSVPPAPLPTEDGAESVAAHASWLREIESSKFPDRLHVYRELRALDRDGGTQSLVQELQEQWPETFERLQNTPGPRLGAEGHQVNSPTQAPSAETQTSGESHKVRTEESEKPRLAPRQECILIAMLEMDAVSEEKRKAIAAIREQAEGTPSEQSTFKDLVAELSRRGLVRTKRGRGGGCWLTPEGLATAREEQRRLDGDDRTSD